MRTSSFTRVLCVVIITLAAVSASQALTISVQFAPGTLFSPSLDGMAKAAINAAAADISDAITSSLDPINSDIVVGSYSSTTATFDARFFYENPSTGANETISSATMAADTVTLFVGTRRIGGTTLGVGGPGGTVAGLTGATGSPNGWVNAVADAESQLNDRYGRGGGPTIGTSSGMTSYGFPGEEIDADYNVDYGITVGNLWFDIDTDNNGVNDSAQQLSDSWHFSHNSDVPFGKDDLYSVAVHEILHAIGFGTANSWDDLVSGTTWNGSEVHALVGSGANLVDGGSGHITSNIMSTRISDGMPQEVAMDPSITEGTRKELTELDLAFLRDIGYETVTPSFPNPPDYDGDGDVDYVDLVTLENWFGENGNADADGDGDTDGADFLVWQRQFTGPIGTLGAANVPEPASVWLVGVGILLAGARRRPGDNVRRGS